MCTSRAPWPRMAGHLILEALPALFATPPFQLRGHHGPFPQPMLLNLGKKTRKKGLTHGKSGCSLLECDGSHGVTVLASVAHAVHCKDPEL